MPDSNFRYVSIPRPLADHVEELLNLELIQKKMGYLTLPEVCREALRNKVKEIDALIKQEEERQKRREITG